MSETAWMSAIVLPDLNYLESWHYAPTRASPWASHSAIRQPVVNAFGLKHDGYSILWELARRLGILDAYVEAMNGAWGLKTVKFEKGKEYSAKDAVEVIWRDKTGKPFDVATTAGFVGSHKNADAFYLRGVEAKCKGPGKPKLQFYSDGMAGTMQKVRETVEKNGIKNIDLKKYELAYAPMPKKEHAFPTPHVDAANLPFYLISFKRIYRNQSACSNTNPILNFALGKDTQENAILLNTSAARKLGVRDGDPVTIETRIGKVTGTCKLTEGIRPDTVGVSYHHGHAHAGWPDYARKGVDVNRVVELHPDLVCGMNSTNDTKCSVVKA